MKEFLRNRWILFVVSAIFIVCKLPHLHYAYYWDECWPYAAAIRDMYRHGISLLPGAMDSELSRGHPLLFHALAAGWMKIFGTSHESMHSFALLLSLLFLIAIYEVGLRLFSLRVAILSLLLVSTQVIFFVQSSFVLLEVLVSLLCFLSVYTYVKERYLYTLLCLSALFYTKESGLILGLVLGTDAFIALFNRKKELRVRVARVLSVLIPCILTALFFVVQKHTRGWYVFPLHTGLVRLNWTSFWFSFRINALQVLFVFGYRYYYFWILLAVSVIAAVKSKDARYLILFLPGVIIYYFVDDMRAGRIIPSVPFFILFMISVALMLLIFVKLGFFESITQKRFIVLSCVFIFCFLCFSSLLFLTPRYLLAAIVPLLFFAAVVLDVLVRRTYNWLFYPSLIAISAISCYNFKTDHDFGDCNLGAFDGLDVQQHVVDYFEQHNYYNKNIACQFMENEHLTDPATGFLHSDKPFANVRWDVNGYTDFVIFDNIENDYRYNELVGKDTTLHLAYRYEKGRVWAEVYERKR